MNRNTGGQVAPNMACGDISQLQRSYAHHQQVINSVSLTQHPQHPHVMMENANANNHQFLPPQHYQRQQQQNQQMNLVKQYQQPNNNISQPHIINDGMSHQLTDSTSQFNNNNSIRNNGSTKLPVINQQWGLNVEQSQLQQCQQQQWNNNNITHTSSIAPTPIQLPSLQQQQWLQQQRLQQQQYNQQNSIAIGGQFGYHLPQQPQYQQIQQNQQNQQNQLQLLQQQQHQYQQQLLFQQQLLSQQQYQQQQEILRRQHQQQHNQSRQPQPQPPTQTLQIPIAAEAVNTHPFEENVVSETITLDCNPVSRKDSNNEEQNATTLHPNGGQESEELELGLYDDIDEEGLYDNPIETTEDLINAFKGFYFSNELCEKNLHNLQKDDQENQNPVEKNSSDYQHHSKVSNSEKNIQFEATITPQTPEQITKSLSTPQSTKAEPNGTDTTKNTNNVNDKDKDNKTTNGLDDRYNNILILAFSMNERQLAYKSR